MPAGNLIIATSRALTSEEALSEAVLYNQGDYILLIYERLTKITCEHPLNKAQPRKTGCRAPARFRSALYLEPWRPVLKEPPQDLQNKLASKRKPSKAQRMRRIIWSKPSDNEFSHSITPCLKGDGAEAPSRENESLFNVDVGSWCKNPYSHI